MDRQSLFEHFYDQYKVQSSEADYLYKRAALWLTADGLVATAFAGLATADPSRRFAVDVREPTAAVIGVVTASSLAAALLLMGIALLPRTYGRYSLPDEIQLFRSRYRQDLANTGYPAEHRDTAEVETTYNALANTLAEKTRLNWEVNEKRHRILGWSSVFTFGAVAGLMLLLAGAIIRTTTPSGPNPHKEVSSVERPPPNSASEQPASVGDADQNRAIGTQAGPAAAVVPTPFRNDDQGRVIADPSFSGWGTSLAQNVVGGALVGVLGWLLAKGWGRVRARSFGHFFGSNIVETGVALVCGELQLREEVTEAAAAAVPGIQSEFPFRKPGVPDYRVTVSSPVGISEIRAVNYLSSEFRRWLKHSPRIASDLGIRGDLNLNFVSLGFGSNLKTRDALGNTSNTFVDTNFSDSFTDRGTGTVSFTHEPGFDYGLILKLHPKQFPERTWIACAGINEWGTSGTAWFLANKWRNGLYGHVAADGRRVGSRSFAAWIRVRHGQDESAELVRLVLL